jgi:glycine cleavage system H protein
MPNSSSVTSCTSSFRTSAARFQAGESFGSIESVKAVSELFAPMAGEVLEVNPTLKDHPEMVNSDPHRTWMIRVRLADPDSTKSLLDSTQYEAILT